ncbi:MAG TPA: cell wall-binding repeat-containing protein [candidate division Zixibacteria bacterium]|nr:cell wall-binding repeat-containing protein [candidate division Zixibacteria bacterium]
MTLQKESSTTGPVAPGASYTYTLTAENVGAETVAAVAVRDTNLDLGQITVTNATFTVDGGAPTACDVDNFIDVDCEVGTLNSGSTVVVTITVQVASDPATACPDDGQGGLDEDVLNRADVFWTDSTGAHSVTDPNPDLGEPSHKVTIDCTSAPPPTSTPTPSATATATASPTASATATATATPTATPIPSPTPTVTRISGADRYETAAKLSATLIDPDPPATGGTVVVASGENFPDALTGAPLAFANDAPVLLVKAASLQPATLAELNRLDPEQIYILGGTVAVSTTVENQLKALSSTPTVTRIMGADRYGSAAAVAGNAAFSGATTVFLASGENFPDAMSGGGAASRNGWPILLAKRSSLPQATCDRIKAMDPTKIYVLGGEVAISTTVANTAAACSDVVTSVERLAGADRFATSAAINAEFFTSGTVDHALVATGRNFPDALAAGAVGDPVYLTDTTDLPTSVFDAIVTLDPSTIHVMGGPVAVAEAVLTELRAT